MISRTHLFGLALTGLFMAMAVPASAMMPPYVYEDARTNAVDVVVIAVENVAVPQTYGHCAVSGTVHAVERGTRYKAGEPITIQVDCLTAWGPEGPLVGGTIWQDSETMRQSRYGRAYLDESGAVSFSQYEQLSEEEL